MLNKINIGSKITALVLVLTFLGVAAISTIAYQLTKQSVEDSYAEKLQMITKYKKEKIETYFQNINSELIKINQSIKNDVYTTPDLLDDESTFDSSDTTAIESSQAINMSDMAKINQIVENESSISQIWIVSNEGTILYSKGNATSSDQTGMSFYDPDGETISRSADSTYVSRVFNEGKEHFLFIGLPFYDKQKVIIGKVNVADLFAIMYEPTGLGQTGESFIVEAENEKITYVNPSRIKENAPLSIFSKVGSKNQQAVQRSVQQNDGYIYDNDYRGEKTLAAWSYMPLQKWGIVTKIDNSEIQAQVSSLIPKFGIACIITCVLATIISLVFSRALTDAVLSLKNTLQLLSEGILPKHVEKKGNDEIGQMAETTGRLVGALQRTATFAHQIGAGKLDASFKPISNEDTLGNALINMRDNILNSEKRDDERNWIVTGVAEIGEILRSHDQLENLGDAVTAYVCRKINAIQGAFYVVNDNDKFERFH